MLVVKTQNHCDVCKRLFVEGEPILIKCPEGIWFCLHCSEKKVDNKTYTKDSHWITTEYAKGIEVVRE